MKTEVTEEQQEHLEMLIESGEKLEAIRYVQQTFGLDAEQAITMIERAEQQMEGVADTELEKSIKELERSTANLPAIIGTIFSVIGIVLIALASWFGYRSYNFLEKAAVVPGIVKEFKERIAKDRDNLNPYTLYMPVLQYRFEGKDYTYDSPYGSTTEEYVVGDQISLLVDPSNPGAPEENTFMNNWFLPMLLGALGLIFTGVGIVVRKAFSKP